MKTILSTFLLLALCLSAQAQSALQVTQTAAPLTVTVGQPIITTISLKNVLTPRPPFTITATATWEDQYGIAQSTNASATIQVVQPIKVKTWTAALSSLFGLVAGSATLNGQPVTPTLASGVLTFDLGSAVLNEGQSVTIGYSVKAQ